MCGKIKASDKLSCCCIIGLIHSIRAVLEAYMPRKQACAESTPPWMLCSLSNNYRYCENVEIWWNSFICLLMYHNGEDFNDVLSTLSNKTNRVKS